MREMKVKDTIDLLVKDKLEMLRLHHYDRETLKVSQTSSNVADTMISETARS